MSIVNIKLLSGRHRGARNVIDVAGVGQRPGNGVEIVVRAFGLFQTVVGESDVTNQTRRFVAAADDAGRTRRHRQ